MKTHLFTLLILIGTISSAQVPSDYYDSANGLNGYTLKTALKNIISTGHVDQGYGALYTAYQTTDTDIYYENDNSVLDMYSENPSGADPYNYQHDTNGGADPGDACGGAGFNSESDCYNREHLFPQGFFNSLNPMRPDVHHVIPTDGFVNGLRSNFPFGVVTSPTQTSNSGSKLGNNVFPGYTGTVFEPIDEFKGDIARCLLYFATRYEDEAIQAAADGSGTWDPHTASNNPMDGTSDQFYEDWYINLLITWHNNDPVSQKELDRNDAAYNFQGNANPFISHPEYVGMIWTAVANDTEAPSVPTNLMVSNEASTSIDLSWADSTDNVGVTGYDVYVDGVFDNSVTTTSATVNGLTANTTYAFSVLAKDASGNSSAQSTALNGTTTAPDTEAPTVPTNLIVSNETATTIDISWIASTDNEGVAEYDVYVDGVYNSSVSDINATITGLTAETTYSITVLAKDAVGNSSDQSIAVNGTTTMASSSCATETFTNIGAASSSYTMRTWTGDDGGTWTATNARTDQTITGNSIALDGRGADNGTLTSPSISGGIGSLTVTTQRKFSGGTGNFNLYVNGTLSGTIPYDDTVQTTTINDINIEGDVTIVITEDSGNNRVAIDDLSWTCYDTLSIEENNLSSFKVYPNPSNGTIFISLEDVSENIEVKVFDITGKLILISDISSSNQNSMLVDLPKGMLFVQLTNSKISTIKKVMVR